MLISLSACSIIGNDKYSGYWVGTDELYFDRILFLTLNEDNSYVIEYISDDYLDGKVEIYQEGRYNISNDEITFEYFLVYSDTSITYTYDIDTKEISESSYYSDGELNKKTIHFTKIDENDVINKLSGSWELSEYSDGNIVKASNYQTLTINKDMTFYFNENAEVPLEYRLDSKNMYLATVLEISYDDYENVKVTVTEDGELV